jgi:hypothetical protein
VRHQIIPLLLFLCGFERKLKLKQHIKNPVENYIGDCSLLLQNPVLRDPRTSDTIIYKAHVSPYDHQQLCR